MTKSFPFAILAVLFAVPAAHAEQPIFDEMPRWNGGWGIQMMQEFRLHQEENLEANSAYESAEEHIHLTHIQGVYTWHRSIRLTAKIPVVVFAEKTLKQPSGGTSSLQDQGLGDPTLALPLKSYFNLDGRSGSWTLTPQVRIPGGGTDTYDVYSRKWATGLSGGYSTETHRYFLMTSVGGWYGFEGSPWEAQAGVHFGLNYSLGERNGHVFFKQYASYKDTNRASYGIGPTAYLRVTDEFHVQLQTRHDVVSWDFQHKDRREDSFRVGVAVVY